MAEIPERPAKLVACEFMFIRRRLRSGGRQPDYLAEARPHRDSNVRRGPEDNRLIPAPLTSSAATGASVRSVRGEAVRLADR